jgi:hypothetical protein
MSRVAVHVASSEGGRGGMREVHVCRLDARRARIRRHQPEDAVNTLECRIDNGGVGVRSSYDAHAVAHLLRDTSGFPGDHTDRRIDSEEVLEYLATDLAGRRSDDDHVKTLMSTACSSLESAAAGQTTAG